MENASASSIASMQPTAKSLPEELQVPINDFPYRLLGLMVVIFMLGGFFLWAVLSPLQSAVVAPGQVMVESRNKPVQHLEGGIVEQVYVKEGDLVNKGQLLLELSDVQIRAQYNLVTAQANEALVNLDRLQSEQAAYAKVRWSNTVQSLSTDSQVQAWMKTQEQLFEQRKKSLKAQLRIRQDQILQAKTQVKGIGQVLDSLQKRITNLTKDIEDQQALFKQQYVDKTKLRDMQQQLEQLNTQVISYTTEQQKFQQQMQESQHQIQLLQDEFMRDVGEKIAAYQVRLADAQQRQISIADQLQRSKIYAPDSGRIMGFEINNPGSIVEPRRMIMQIVPQDGEFSVMAQVQPQDIDQVKVGQKVEIKLSAFNTRFIPVIFGEVVLVGADVQIDPISKTGYYKVKVHLDAESLVILHKQNWQLMAGMPAEAYIKTHSRTLMDYVIKPFRLMLSRAFNEDDGL